MALAIERMWGDGFKLKERCKEETFVIRVVRHRNRLPTEVVDVASLKTFKLRLNNGSAQCNLLEDVPSPYRGLDLVVFKGPFQRKLFCDSMKNRSENNHELAKCCVWVAYKVS